MDCLDLIGLPFEFGGRGPDVYDCYGLIMELHRRQGVELPDYRSPEVLIEVAQLVDQEKYRWDCHASRTTDQLIPFSVMSPGRVLMIRVKGQACHVGFVHKPRKFLHTWHDTGGVTEERIDLWRQRILGVYSYAG